MNYTAKKITGNHYDSEFEVTVDPEGGPVKLRFKRGGVRNSSRHHEFILTEVQVGIASVVTIPLGEPDRTASCNNIPMIRDMDRLDGRLRQAEEAVEAARLALLDAKANLAKLRR